MLEIIQQQVDSHYVAYMRSADTIDTYLEYTTKHYGSIWKEGDLVRDSLSAAYADDPVLYEDFRKLWQTKYGERFMELDKHLKATKSIL